MASRSQKHDNGRSLLQRLKDLVVTLFLWLYFTAGFVLFFSPIYLLAFLFVKDRRRAFQRLNSMFFKSFFLLCKLLIPRHKWDISPSVRAIRSSIIVCNHVSYLDSILLVSLFSKHTTIAKDRLFAIPIFGTVLRVSGYIPSSGRGRYADLLINSLDAIAGHLEDGGNVIVFPEGTRSRDGRIGKLHKGVFKIARYCNASIKVLRVSNTDMLFAPGKFLFSTCIDNSISLRMISEIVPDYKSDQFATGKLVAQVQALLDGNRNRIRAFT